VLASAAVPAAQISGGRWEIRFALPEPLPLNRRRALLAQTEPQRRARHG
jgi:hypothetical protein